MQSAFSVGDKVRSAPRGKTAAFDGVVVEVFPNGVYTVRDYLKRRWQREAIELEKLQ